MWHSGSKCWIIEALGKANFKRLKADLASGVRKLGSQSLASKLGQFRLFDGFFNFLLLDFPKLDNFWDLANFWLSNLLVLAPHALIYHLIYHDRQCNHFHWRQVPWHLAPHWRQAFMILWLFLALTWVVWLSYLTLGWIINKNWQSARKPRCLILT